MEERRANEERVYRTGDGADQAADGMLGIREQPDGDVIERQLVRHRLGDECRHAGRDFDQPPGAFRREIGRAHVILGSAGIGGVILGFEPSLK